MEAESRPLLPLEANNPHRQHDLCFVFSEEEKCCQSHKALPLRQVEEELLTYCIARDATSTQAKQSKLDVLPECYQMRDVDLSNLTHRSIRRLILTAMANVLRTQIGAVVSETRALDGSLTFLFVTLPEEAARRLAQHYRYPLQMNASLFDAAFRHRNPQFSPPFLYFDQSLETQRQLQCLKDTKERLWKVYKSTSPDSSGKWVSIFRDVDKGRLLIWSLQDFFNLEGMLKRKRIMERYFIPHDRNSLQRLRESWGRWGRVLQIAQPLDEIRDYFGEEVALYFAWMETYVRGLSYLALFGVGASLLSLNIDPQEKFKSKTMDVCRVLLATVTSVWATWFYREWQAKQIYLSHRWGTNVIHSGVMIRHQRQQFKKDRSITDPVLPDRRTSWYSPAKWYTKTVITNLITTVAVIFAIIVVNEDVHEQAFLFFGSKDRITSGFQKILPAWLTALVNPVSLLTALTAYVFDVLWGGLAEGLANFENHKYESDWEKSVIRRLFLFTAFDYFIPLYHLAFTKMLWQPCWDEDPEQGRCLISLQSQLRSLFVVAAGSNIVEIGMPFIAHRFKTWWRSRQAGTKRHLPEYESENEKDDYESTRDDFQEMMLIMMLVSLFGSAWFILPALALIIVIIELRVDAVKLCTVVTRPFPKPAMNTGTWSGVMASLANLTVVTNISLCAFTTFGKSLPVVQKMLLATMAIVCCFFLREMLRCYKPAVEFEADLLRAQQSAMLYEATWGRDEKAARKLGLELGRSFEMEFVQVDLEAHTIQRR